MMVRVLSIICERHGELYCDGVTIPAMPPINALMLHEGSVVGRCKPCDAEGHKSPHPLLSPHRGGRMSRCYEGRVLAGWEEVARFRDEEDAARYRRRLRESGERAKFALHNCPQEHGHPSGSWAVWKVPITTTAEPAPVVNLDRQRGGGGRMSEIRPDVKFMKPLGKLAVHSATIAAIEHGIALLEAAGKDCDCYGDFGHFNGQCRIHRLLAEQRALLEEARG